jgi:RNA polymerase subunit RPABC4/transcription elongation factor Spt4
MDAWVCDVDEIQWECSVCGDKGIVKGWTGLIWDMLDVENDTSH